MKPLAILPLLLAAAALPTIGSGATEHVVALNCLQFVPQVIEIQSGDTVRWHWEDTCGIGHTVTSQESTLSAEQDLDKPQPHIIAQCFDASNEIGQLWSNNLNYTVSFGEIARIVVRDPGTDKQNVCPAHNSVQDADTIVVPYFCRFHGAANAPGAGMRGAIVIHIPPLV